MSDYADESYNVYKETIRKARTEHRCDACRSVIRPGDYYCNVKTVFDGSAETIKRCGACQLTHVHLRELCLSNEADMWPDEKLGCGKRYDDEWGEEPPEEIAALPLLSDAERGALLAPKIP